MTAGAQVAGGPEVARLIDNFSANALIEHLFRELRPDGHRGGITSSGSQILVDKLDRRGALAHCRCDALNRAAARVARGEHSRHAGLQEIWLSFEAPAMKRTSGSKHVATSQDVSFRVHLHDICEPLCVWRSSD